MGRDGTGWGGLLEEDTPAGESARGAPTPNREPDRGPRREKPAGAGPPCGEPGGRTRRAARRVAAPRGRPRASPASGETRGLSLPMPEPRPARTPPDGPDLSPESSRFDGARFAELAASPGDRAPGAKSSPRTASPDGTRTGFWKEYGEVVVSIIAGIAVVTAAVLYTSHAPSADPAPKAVVDRGPRPVPTPPRPGAIPTPDEPRKAREPALPAKTRTPMLSVLSSPSGALVDIGGVIYGKTPLVMPSPNAESLSITLKLGGFRTWRKVVRPRETGHFSVHVKLTKPE